MRLKNIKLAGFKSFVDPTNVQLTSDLVAVVGPNGCGKSNIIDAVRWVMGESSAKTLRGESMADVIFNGSTARKPVGQASIELIFDNSDATLTGEYAAFTEISIKRKVTRDGQSQYLINGAKCRRRDITGIFLGTGLGPRSYAIIEQGMISRMIESKPEELRVFVEEAAGISKYKERRRETETRIRHTRENLERLTDIREELDRQLQRLQRQATAAEKYKGLKIEERSVKAQTLSLQWQMMRNKSSGQRDAIQQHEISLEESIAEQRAVDAKIEELRSQQTEYNDLFNAVQARYYGVGAEIARLEQSISHHEQRASQLTQDISETESNASESTQHLAEDTENFNLWKTELNEIEPHHETLTESESASSEALSLAESNMQDWQSRWDGFNESAAEPQKNAEVQRSRIDQIEEALRGLGTRMERMTSELSELNADSLVEEKEQHQEAIEIHSAQLDSLHQQLAEGTEQVGQRRDALKYNATALDAVRSLLQEKRGKYASLDALQVAAQADSEGDSSEWLAAHSLSSAPRLLDEIHAESGWETAFETVLGDNLQAVSVERIDNLANSLSGIGENNLSFVERGSSAGDTATGRTQVNLPWLSSKLEQPHAVPSNWLAGVYVADTLQQALQVRAQLSSVESVVTKDGIWVGSTWLRVHKQKDARSGVIERRKTLLILAEEIGESDAKVVQLQMALEQAEQDVLNAEQHKDSLMQSKSNEEQALGAVRGEVGALDAKIEQVRSRIARTQEEVKHAEQNQQQQREALTEARGQLDVAIESMQQVEETREQLLLERDHVRDALTVTRETAKTDREALQAVAVRAEGLRVQIQSVQATIERLTGQVQQLQSRTENLRQSQEENNSPIEGLQNDLKTHLASRMLVESELTESRTAVESVDLAMRENEQTRGETEQATQGIRALLEKLRLDSQEMAVRTKTIEEQLEESGFVLQVVLEGLPEEAEFEAWQENLDVIGKRIERLGAINLAAIEEFDTESERKKYLDAQNEELESALSTLENAIQKIDRETRSLFKDTFDKLNASLQDLFPKVFGGGEASLEMTGDDLLDTGISIMARPPGKRNSTIHLLSGGEKALTAIALVFSIFQLNPAPFCMLDEVDAPLDDANTGRYARLIKEMSNRVQFIFITHNKITMEMADHLMGVTMHEPGCSRLVSVDIDEAMALATA